jgi:hypothetical protein
MEQDAMCIYRTMPKLMYRKSNTFVAMAEVQIQWVATDYKVGLSKKWEVMHTA